MWLLLVSLHGSNGAAVDDVFRAGDGGRSIAGQEGNELGDFFRFGGSAERDATQRGHKRVERVFA